MHIFLSVFFINFFLTCLIVSLDGLFRCRWNVIHHSFIHPSQHPFVCLFVHLFVFITVHDAIAIFMIETSITINLTLSMAHTNWYDNISVAAGPGAGYL